MARPDARLLRLDRRVRLQLGLLAVIGLVVALLVVVQARVLAGALARTIDAGVRPTAIAPPVLALLAIIAARALLAWAVTKTSGSTARRAKSTLRAAMAGRVLRDDAGGGPADAAELTILLSRGLDGLDGYFTKYLPQLVAAVVVPLVVGLAILGADVTSAIVIAVTLPLIPLFMVLIGMATRERERRSWRSLSRLAHHYTDLLAGLPTLKVFGRARAQVEGLRRTNEAYRSETVSTLRLAFCSALVLELGSTLAVALVAVGIGLRLLDGTLHLETAFFVLLLAPEVFLPVRAVGIHYHESAAGIAVAERSFEILDATLAARPPTAPVTVNAAPDSVTAAATQRRLSATRVLFDHVCFTYPTRRGPAVENLTVALEPGEVVALTGASGSGKSTAVALLLGLIDPESGSIRIGGRDLREIDLGTWHRNIAWLAQRPTLLAGTVADNVRLGAPQASDADVLVALERAGATALEPSRPVGERGEGLSVGERRRVGLARALARLEVGGAWLLVVDEPTAGLDPSTEELVVRRAITDLAGAGDVGDGLTRVSVLIVTHRAATAASADRVVRLPEPASRPDLDGVAVAVGAADEPGSALAP